MDKYKAKREAWIQRVTIEDRNSIQRQIWSMIWDAAVYRIINEARKYAKEVPEGGVELNGMVHRLIDKCFFQSQANAIRRLLDRSPAKGGKEVYSLYRLLEDIKENIHLCTRENIFATEERPYDYGPVQKEYFEYCEQQAREGNRSIMIPPELVWHRHEERHQDIDKLASVDKDNRSPNDTIRPEVISRLKNKLGSCREIVDYVDKFVAHAATPESRATIKADEITLTLGKFWDAHEVICNVANFVSKYILGDSNIGSLAIPQYDHFAYIDRPLIESENVEKLHEVWNKYEKETQSWGNWSIDDFIKDVNG